MDSNNLLTAITKAIGMTPEKLIYSSSVLDRQRVAGITTDPSDIEILLSDPDENVRRSLTTNSSITEEHVDALVNDPSEKVRRDIAINRKLSDHQYDQLLNDPWCMVRGAAAEHATSLTDEHYQRLLKDSTFTVVHATVSRKDISSKHLHLVVSDPNADRFILYCLLLRANLTSEHLDCLLVHPDQSIRELAAKRAAGEWVSLPFP